MDIACDKALDEFLDDENCDEIQENFYQLVKRAFEAGYKSRKPLIIPQVLIIEK